MTYFLYNIATSLAAPLGAAYLRCRRKHRALLGRFNPEIPSLGSARPFWVHACSVGEVNTAKALVVGMRARWPETPVLLTTSTQTGYELARGIGPATWCPFDSAACVRRFVRTLNPRALLVVETEVWPNLYREPRKAGVPVVLINGRLSDRHYPRYVRLRRFLKPVLEQLSAAGMQNDEYAQRLVALGVDAARVRVTGNIKFDNTPAAVDPDVLASLRAQMGIEEGRPVLLFGSTRPGDEALAAACWRALRCEFPDLLLVIAPRHLDRLSEALAPLGDERVLLRTQTIAGRTLTDERVLVLDTVGELAVFYGLATVAVVGGSFYPGVNGHNPLEPAGLGVPTVFGPYMRNFADPARELVIHGGAVQTEAAELGAALRKLLSDAEARRVMGARAREVVAANRGAVERTLDLLETVLREPA